MRFFDNIFQSKIRHLKKRDVIRKYKRQTREARRQLSIALLVSFHCLKLFKTFKELHRYLCYIFLCCFFLWGQVYLDPLNLQIHEDFLVFCVLFTWCTDPLIEFVYRQRKPKIKPLFWFRVDTFFLKLTLVIERHFQKCDSSDSDTSNLESSDPSNSNVSSSDAEAKSRKSRKRSRKKQRNKSSVRELSQSPVIYRKKRKTSRSKIRKSRSLSRKRYASHKTKFNKKRSSSKAKRPGLKRKPERSRSRSASKARSDLSRDTVTYNYYERPRSPNRRYTDELSTRESRRGPTERYTAGKRQMQNRRSSGDESPFKNSRELYRNR